MSSTRGTGSTRSDPAVDRLTDVYLRRLTRAARRLPRTERRELVADIEAHLRSAIEVGGGGEAAVRNVIDQLGPPEAIVASTAHSPTSSPTFRDTATIVLLLLGGFLLLVGWLVGLVLLLSSTVWSGRQKVVAALVWPGGLVTVFYFGVVGGISSSQTACSDRVVGAARSATLHCTSSGVGSSAAGKALVGIILVAAVVAPIAVAVWLYRTAARVRSEDSEATLQPAL